MSDETRQPDARTQALLQRLRALPRSVEPAHDLWPGIEARITAPPRRERSAVARAAAVVLLVLGSLLAGDWAGYGLALRHAQATTAATPPAASDVERLEAAFDGARASYLRELALGGEGLDAPARSTLRTQLEVIDHAVHELKDAMAGDPHNPLYLDTLLMTREREMELLADISRASTTRL